MRIGRLAFRILSTTHGAGDRRTPFVLVHGIGMSHRYLSRLHAVLATAGPVYSIDLPGFAGLPKPGEDVDVARMGAALADVIAGLDIGPVVLLGHSMGAQWVVEAALHSPQSVQLVVAIGPVTDAAHRSFGAQMIALAMDTLGESPLTNMIVFTDYVRCGIPWYLAQVRHMLTYRIEERVELLTAPLLVMRGGRDPIAGLAWCRLLVSAARDGRLVQIPGRPHVAQHGGTRAVASALVTCADPSRAPDRL